MSSYRLVSEEYQPVTENPTAWFVCPQCGYSKVKFPSRPEIWKEYQAEGIIDIRQEVVDVNYIVARSDADFLRAMALYIPTVVGSLVMQQLGITSPLFTSGVVGIGAAVLYIIAARHRLMWGKPEPELQVEPEPEALPATTEIHERRGRNQESLFRFSKQSVTYQSGECVPDYYLWRIADAFEHGAPFSRQMWSGSSKVVSRPAFEALRDAFVVAGIAYHDGQDIALKARGRNILGQWARLERPHFPMENPRIGTVRPHSPSQNLGVQ